MSDALTDLSRDQDRARAFRDYLLALVNFVKDPTNGNRTAAISAAQATDGVRRGFNGGQTALGKTVERTLDGLQSGDVPTWLTFLSRLTKLDPEYANNVQAAHAPTELKNAVLVEVDYGYGFVTFAGGLEAAIAQRIQTTGGGTYHGEKYTMAISRDAIEKAHVFPIPNH